MQINEILKSHVLEVLVISAFMFFFTENFELVMYLLAFVIFYFYIPQFYIYSRVNIFNHIKNKEFIHLKYYPLEFVFWLLATCFFSFILAHLLADLAYGADKHIHYVIYLLIVTDLGFICYRELAAKQLDSEQLESNFEKQGRLLSFEILFLFLILFMIPH